MRLRSAAAVLIGAFLVTISGCDNYSLTGKYLLPGETVVEELTLSAQSATVQQNEEVSLNAAGGVSPYSFTVSAVDLYTKTSSKPVGGVYNGKYTAGTAIGRFKITMTDAAGTSAETYVTVVPPTPSLSLFAWTGTGGYTGVTIDWTYADTTIIDSFIIQRSIDGGTYTDWQSPGKNETTTSDNYGGVTSSSYSYRIYAVSGSYRSLPTEKAL